MSSSIDCKKAISWARHKKNSSRAKKTQNLLNIIFEIFRFQKMTNNRAQLHVTNGRKMLKSLQLPSNDHRKRHAQLAERWCFPHPSRETRLAFVYGCFNWELALINSRTSTQAFWRKMIDIDPYLNAISNPSNNQEKRGLPLASPTLWAPSHIVSNRQRGFRDASTISWEWRILREFTQWTIDLCFLLPFTRWSCLSEWT